MPRFFDCLPSNQDYNIEKDYIIETQPDEVRPVSNNTLILLAAKGYEHVNGDNSQMKVSSLDLMTKLLTFSEMRAVINYAEGSLDHTALHIACIRRNCEMITLLLTCGADPNLTNHCGQSPLNLLEDLSYASANVVLRYHTSPDYHPNTHWLDKDTYDNQDNLYYCRRLLENAVRETDKSYNSQTPSVKPDTLLKPF